MINSLSFVFPMYNEIDNIEETVREATRVGRSLTDRLEIIVVDDASTDGSGGRAESLKDAYPELVVVHHPVNRKLGGALRTGFAVATMDWILYIDSDLPIHMDDIRQALPLTEEADMVIGFRLSRAESYKREVMSKVYNWLIRAAFGLAVRDVNFSFKLFKRSIMEKVVLQSEGSFIDAELLIEAARSGCRIREVGFEYYPRAAGVSTLASPAVVWKMLQEMQAYRREAVARARRVQEEKASR